MKSLSDDQLKEAYFQAKKSNMDPYFIRLLDSELKKRSINIYKDQKKE